MPSFNVDQLPYVTSVSSDSLSTLTEMPTA